MKPTKQTVYLPVNTDEPSLVVQQYQREIVEALVEEREGYFFTPEQLNQLLSDVIKDALNTAAEKVILKDYSGKERGKSALQYSNHNSFTVIIDNESITSTLEETFNKHKV